MDWFCDEMLGRLARLLRAAGHDTALAPAGTADRALLDRARAEGRILLTRDRRLAETADRQGCLLRGQSVEEQARSLAAAFPVDWLQAPFTRCLLDNCLLHPAPPDRLAEVPPGARSLTAPFGISFGSAFGNPSDRSASMTSCPCCGRLYWPGSHVRRLTGTLRRLAQAGKPHPG